MLPSWLDSWIFWRNRYTTPGQPPFNLLGYDERFPLRGRSCPICNDEYVLQDGKGGAVYCICQVLEWQDKLVTRYEDLRTDIGPAKLSDIRYPIGMPGEAVRTLKNAVDLAAQFVRSPKQWLVIVGAPGCGKTHILKAINTQLYPVSVYMASRDLEDKTHEYRKADDMQELYRLLAFAPILLIDDVGMEYGGPLVKSMLDRIIDARYERWPDFPTIVTTNMSYDELRFYIPRAGDRMTDLAKVIPVGIKAGSYRQVHQALR